MPGAAAFLRESVHDRVPRPVVLASMSSRWGGRCEWRDVEPAQPGEEGQGREHREPDSAVCALSQTVGGLVAAYL